MTTLQKLEAIRNNLLSRAAQVAAYNWDGEFCKEEIREFWKAGKLKIDPITVKDLKKLSRKTLYANGFGNWNDKLILIPLWMWNYIAEGEELTSIMGKACKTGSGWKDLDVRAGCVAYGFTL